MDTLRKALDELREENTKDFFKIIGMKDERLTYQEARIDAMQREIEKLNIEILNLEYKLKQAENAINEYN
jgi:predicted RNase H-like nuclease (RuvC/YqgF family)